EYIFDMTTTVVNGKGYVTVLSSSGRLYLIQLDSVSAVNIGSKAEQTIKTMGNDAYIMLLVPIAAIPLIVMYLNIKQKKKRK
ncbi:MAG: hypothetical protein Q6363_004390, partial [Candidatus Njordarchaeota archaeon]